MPKFKYRSMERDGTRKEATAEFPSLRALERSAAARGATVVWVKEERFSGNASKSGRRRLKNPDLEEFTNLLSALLESGLTLRDAVDVVRTAASRDAVRAFAGEVAGRIEAGRTLDGAFDDLRMDLPVIYRGLVRIGEKTGAIEKVYPRLAQHLASEKKTRERLSNAMIYPITVLSLAVFGAIGLSFYLLPRLATIFGDMGGAAGAMLKGRVATATFVSVVLSVLLVGAGLAFPIIKIMKHRDKRFAARVDGLLMKFPVIGPFLRDRETLTFSFAMESLTAGGLTIDESLEECAKAAGNKAFAADLQTMREKVRKGASLSSACEGAKRIPPYLKQWLAVGERTGQVDKVFGQVRAYYQGTMDHAIERIMNMAEPAVILLVGIIVLVLVGFFILPIFSAYGSLL